MASKIFKGTDGIAPFEKLLLEMHLWRYSHFALALGFFLKIWWGGMTRMSTKAWLVISRDDATSEEEGPAASS